MSKPDLLVIGPYPDWDMLALAESYTLHRLWEAPDKSSFLSQHAENIQAIATRGDLGASAELMAQLPNLRIVSVFGVGTDGVDLAYARSKSIKVTNTPDVLTGDVADHGMALLLAAARLMPQGDALVRSGKWPAGGLPLTTRVFGKKIGIVGMGRIGQAFAKRAQGFDCDISYFSRGPRPGLPYRFVASLEALAFEADFLVVTLAGGKGTRKIINASVLAALGADGIFVNISRGSTVDEEALLAALESRSIKAAALDVFWNEPNINPRFLALDNAVLHPHHASGTVETRRAMGQLIRDNLAAHFAGESLLTPVA